MSTLSIPAFRGKADIPRLREIISFLANADVCDVEEKFLIVSCPTVRADDLEPQPFYEVGANRGSQPK